MFGGTDVNECVKEAAKKEVMWRVVAGARSLVAFTAATRDTVLQIWVSGVKLWGTGGRVAAAQETSTLTFWGWVGGANRMMR